MEFNWDAIGAAGEIVGAAAVVISLLYLGVQVRNQNSESQAAAKHAFSVGWREISATFTDKDLADIYVKANTDFESLSEAEVLRLLGGLHGVVRIFEEAFDQHRQGRLSSDYWEAINRQYSSLFSASVYQKYWEMRRAWYHEGFQQYVDNMVLTEYELK
jgi:hypothetical protein